MSQGKFKRAGFRLQRLVLPVILALILLTGVGGHVLASDISNALWQGIIRITNTGATTSAVSVNMTLSSADFISGGFANSTLTDAAVRINGVDTAFMPGWGSNPWIIYSPVTPAGNIDYEFYSSNASGGKYRYFPGPGGMTVNDHATLEPGSDNFSVTVSGYIDTAAGSNKYLTNKSNALSLMVSDTVSGNITGEAFGVSTNVVQSNSNTSYTIRNGSYTVMGERFTSHPRALITQVKFSLSKTLSPTGTASINVRKSSDNSLIGTIATLNVATLTTSEAWYTFNTTTVLNPTAQNIDITFEYSGGDASNYVNFFVQNTNPYSGGILVYANPGWGTDAGIDARFDVTYLLPTTITATGVSSGEHTVTFERSSPFYGLGIDTSANFLPPVANLDTNLPLWQSSLSGGSFTSIDSNGYTATVTEAVWSSQGRVFDGVNDKVVAVTSTDLGNTYSVVMWIKTPASLRTDDIMWSVTSGYSPEIYINSNGSFSSYGNGNQTNPGNMGAGIATTNTWYMVTALFNGKNKQIYVNTTQRSNVTELTWNNSWDTTGVNIGFGTNQGAFLGSIGDVIIYDSVLAASDITQIYNATKSTYDGTQAIKVVSSLGNIPNNSSNWVFAQNGSPYVEDIEVRIAGTQRGFWNWQYASTFTDLSGNGNTATPTFRTASSDANVSASLISLAPVSQAKLDSFSLSELSDLLTGIPSTPTGMYSELDFSKVPGAAPINEVLSEGNIPQALWWFPFIYISIALIGLLSYKATTFVASQGRIVTETQQDGSLLVMCIVMELLIALAGIMNPVPFWPALLFPIPAVALIISRKHYSWG